MDIETIAYAVNELKDDVKEIKKDVKSFMLFMAVRKAEDKRNIFYLSSLISLGVSLIVLGVSKLI